MIRKTLSLLLSFSLIITQPIFAQGTAELNIGKYLSQMPALNTDSFRPAHLRYISYDLRSNDFKLLLDQGDTKLSNSPNSSTPKLQDATQELFNYFLIGLSLPNEKFWVNLRPDAPQQIIDPELEKTDMGKIMLEADLQLKKDTAGWTSPQNPEGKEYWDKLYKKARELFGSENITIPTITRPWIVPGEVIIRESEDSAYIYKANLKVMLEEDYLDNQKTEKPKNQKTDSYNFSDPRMKELNKYSTQLIRELILPQLTQEVNTSKKYAQLRQVFFSLILSRWFKDKYKGKPGQYSSLIDSRNLDKISSKDSWSKDYYFSEYKKSFQQGEYNLKEQITTPTGQVIRSYVSGGIQPVPKIEDMNSFRTASPLDEGDLRGLNWIVLTVLVTAGALVYVHSHENPDKHKETQSEITVIADSMPAENKLVQAKGMIRALLSVEEKGFYVEELQKIFHGYESASREDLEKAVTQARNALGANSPKEIRERLDSISKALTASGSSPLTPEEANKSGVSSVVNAKEMAAKFYDAYIVNGKYKKYPTFSKAQTKQDMENVLISVLKNLMLIDYPDIGTTAKIPREIIKEYFSIELDRAFSSINLKRFVIQLKNKSGASSALTKTNPLPTQMTEKWGGIDFTQINYLTWPMGSFQGLDLRLPLLSRAELEGIDINREVVAIEQMINARIDVSTDRLKRLLAAMSQKDAFSAQRETQLLPLLLRLCWLKEEKGAETTPDFRAVLLIADTGLFVEQGNTKYSLN